MLFNNLWIFLTIGSYLFLEGESSAKASWVYHRKNEGNPNEEAQFSLNKTKYCKPENVQKYFANNKIICVEDPRWGANLKENLATFMDEASKTANADMTSYWLTVFAYLSQFHGRMADYKNYDLQPHAPHMVNQLNDKALALIPDDKALLPIMMYLIPAMKGDQIAKLNGTIIRSALQQVASVENFGAMLARLNSRSIRDYGPDITTAVLRLQKDLHLWKLSPEILKYLFSDADFCQKIDINTFLTLGGRRKQAELLTADCAREILPRTETANVGCDARIRVMPPASFGLVESALESSCYSYFTRDHVKNFGTKLNSDSRCNAFQVEHLPDDTIREVDGACLAQRFGNAQLGGNTIMLLYKWRGLDPQILSHFKGQQNLIDRIHPEDWTIISVAQKQVLVDDKETCGFLPATFFYRNGGVTLTRDCFEQLSDGAKGAALRFAKLPNDVLASITSMESWRCFKKELNGEEAEGIDILELASNQPNIGKVIESMSTNDVSHHLCTDIKTIDHLKRLPIIQEFATRACLDSIGEKIEPEHLADLDPRIGQILPMADMVRSMDEKKWADLDCKALIGLLKGTDYCKDIMTAGRWNNIRDECLGELEAGCVAQINCWSEIQSRFIRGIKPAALRNITADNCPEYQALSNEQFAELGADITDLKKHPASKWTAEIISSFPRGRLGYIGARAWAACPEEAYGGLDQNNISNIAADAMVDMRLGQVQKMKLEALQKLAPDQARQVGKNVSGDQNPVCWLADQAVSEEVKKILKDRCSGAVPK